MQFTTRRRAAALAAGATLVAGLGIATLGMPAAAAPTGLASPASVCGWRPANDDGIPSSVIHQAWIRRGGDTSCGTLVAAGYGDHVTVHCSWYNNVSGAYWDYLHDDQRSTTGWLPAAAVHGGTLGAIDCNQQ